jgi:threonine/homoserine/homoserine lactone efflux protein
MTITFTEALLYAGAMIILFLTPGPVWVALMARSLSHGMRGALPLALGVVIGDFIWPFVALFSIQEISGLYTQILVWLRYGAAGIFWMMGAQLIRTASRPISTQNKLMRPGFTAGFVAGLLVIIGNPKAILFYMGVLPGFFDLRSITLPDIIVIALISCLIPLTGNLLLAAWLGRVRTVLSSPKALTRLNHASGVLLILVGLVILLT